MINDDSGDMDFITEGDRVVVTEHIAESEHQRVPRPEAAGQHGLVEYNDGWGLCTVLLDSGERLTAWNGPDLEREVVVDPEPYIRVIGYLKQEARPE